MPNIFANQSDDLLIEEVSGGIGNDRGHGARMELERRMNNRLCESIKLLKEKVTWLNVALTIATIVGAAATALMAWKQFHP